MRGTGGAPGCDAVVFVVFILKILLSCARFSSFLRFFQLFIFVILTLTVADSGVVFVFKNQSAFFRHSLVSSCSVIQNATPFCLCNPCFVVHLSHSQPVCNWPDDQCSFS